MKHSISSTSCITDTSTYSYPWTPRPWWHIQGMEVTCLTCVTFQGRLQHNVNWQTHTNILTEHAAGMDNMIHKNASTCLPGFTVSHRTRLYMALTTVRTSDLTTVFTKVKHQRFTCDCTVLLLCSQFLISKLWFDTVKIQYSITAQFTIMWCPNICILMGGKSKI